VGTTLWVSIKDGVFQLHNSFETRSHPNSEFQPESEDTIFRFGPQEHGWIPITGDWNADGIITAGLVKEDNWRLTNSNNRGQVDIGFRFSNFEGMVYPLASYRGGEEAVEAMALMSMMPLPDILSSSDESENQSFTETPTSIVTITATIPESTPTVLSTVSVTQTEVVPSITWTPEDKYNETPETTSEPTIESLLTPTTIEITPTIEETKIPIATMTDTLTSVPSVTNEPTYVPPTDEVNIESPTPIPQVEVTEELD
jgi:hypothetical protein